MGMIRKTTSVFTAGLVDFRSDKERTARKTAKGARYAKQSAKQAAKQTEIMQQQTRLMQQAAAAQPAAAVAPYPAGDVAARLAQLDDLYRQGMISAEEHAAQRTQILAAI